MSQGFIIDRPKQGRFDIMTGLKEDVKATFYLTISVRGQPATSKIHSPPQRLGTSDRESGQGAWREASCKIERVARSNN